MSRSTAFEILGLALETVGGTKIGSPTHIVSGEDAILTPRNSRYSPQEKRGGLARNFRGITTRLWGEWGITIPADTRIMPLLLNMAAKGGVTTGVGAGTNKVWAFPFDEIENTLKTATVFWGPTDKAGAGAGWYSAGNGFVESLEFTNSADSEDGATVSISGGTSQVESASRPTIPAIVSGSLLPPGMMQMWLDTSSAIGTTLTAGKLISATHKITTGYSIGGAKFLPLGTAGAATKGYTLLSRDPSAIRLETTVMLEVPAEQDINTWLAGTTTKLRIRHNGTLIATTEYNFVEFDTYGPLEDLEWDSYAGSNRVVKFTVRSHYDATLASQARVAVQNDATTL